MNTIPNRKDRSEKRLRAAILGIREHMDWRQDQGLMDVYLACASQTLAVGQEARLPCLQPHENPSRLWIIASQVDQAVKTFWACCRSDSPWDALEVCLNRVEVYADKGWAKLRVAGNIAQGYLLE